MARFYFNVHDGASAADLSGLELRDHMDARSQALRLAGEIIRDSAHRFDFPADWHLDVTDDTGLVLFRLDFHVAVSPAVTR